MEIARIIETDLTVLPFPASARQPRLSLVDGSTRHIVQLRCSAPCLAHDSSWIPP